MKDYTYRRCGLQPPYTNDQYISWFLQLSLSCIFVIGTYILLSSSKFTFLLLPFLLGFFLLLISWILCSTIDTSTTENNGQSLAKEKDKTNKRKFFPPYKPKRYCGICHKASLGLDHHCTWLNTCIAENNYGWFMILIVSCTSLAIYQGIISTLMATIWFDDILERIEISGGGGLKFLLWIYSIINASLGCTVGSLVIFHIFLIFTQQGTYDWLLKGGRIFCSITYFSNLCRQVYNRFKQNNQTNQSRNLSEANENNSPNSNICSKEVSAGHLTKKNKSKSDPLPSHNKGSISLSNDPVRLAELTPEIQKNECV